MISCSLLARIARDSGYPAVPLTQKHSLSRNSRHGCSFARELSRLARSKVPARGYKHGCPRKTPESGPKLPIVSLPLPTSRQKIDQSWSLEALNWDNSLAKLHMSSSACRKKMLRQLRPHLRGKVGRDGSNLPYLDNFTLEEHQVDSFSISFT